jgi:hypothetical protein
MRVICVILTLSACSEGLPAATDLSASDDLSAVHDLSAAHDLSAGLPDLAPLALNCVVAGGSNCALDFFQRFASCFHPAGYCFLAGTLNGEECYQSGAGYRYTSVPSSAAGAMYVQGDMLCALVETDVGTHTDKWTLWDGTVLSVDEQTGVATCAGGNVGVRYMLCSALYQLVYPTSCNAPPPSDMLFGCPSFNQPSPSPSP